MKPISRVSRSSSDELTPGEVKPVSGFKPIVPFRKRAQMDAEELRKAGEIEEAEKLEALAAAPKAMHPVEEAFRKSVSEERLETITATFLRDVPVEDENGDPVVDEDGELVTVDREIGTVKFAEEYERLEAENKAGMAARVAARKAFLEEEPPEPIDLAASEAAVGVSEELLSKNGGIECMDPREATSNEMFIYLSLIPKSADVEGVVEILRDAFESRLENGGFTMNDFREGLVPLDFVDSAEDVEESISEAVKARFEAENVLKTWKLKNLLDTLMSCIRERLEEELRLR